MRRVRYQVASSLDGYIAGPKGEADWIPMDPDIDFAALFAQFDTLLMGRRTFEGLQGGGGGPFKGMKVAVASTTLRAQDHPKARILSGDLAEAVSALRAEEGKDIWLFGGGVLFRSLLGLGLVDTVEIAVLPVLLGGGIPMLPAPSPRATLTLTNHRVYPKTGTALLEYAVEREGPSKERKAKGRTRRAR